MRTIKEEKRIKRLSKSKVNFRIFLLFCFSIIGLTVGYSALNEDLKISGEASVRPIKDVRITDVRLSETTNEGQFNYNNFSVNSISLGASLPNINSTVTYEVDISNIGNVPIIVKSITPEYGENSNIEYVVTGIEVGETKINTNANKTDDDMGLPTTIKVTIKYKDGISQVPTDPTAQVKLIFEFVEPVSILVKPTSDSDTSVFNNTNITKDKIETIEFKGTIDVPEEIPDSNIWDASLNIDNSVIAYYTVNSVTGLYNLVIGGYGRVQFPPNSSYLFYKYANLKSINLDSYIDTSNVTDMSSMFDGCSSLTSLDVSNFNTLNVTSMYGMFSNCSGLTSLDVSSFNTSNVTDMSSMFDGCSSLTSLDVSNFNTSNVTSMFGMFFKCSSLTSLDVSRFNTLNVTNMAYMFYYCSSLTSLDVSRFNTLNVTRMDSMFYRCSSLTSLDVSSFNTSNVTDMYGMFSYCSGLTSLDVSSFNTSNVTDMSRMFSTCSGLTSLDVSNFNTSNVTSIGSMFYNCPGLTSLDVSNFNTLNVTNMWGMFFNCSSLTSLYLNNFNFDKVTSYTYMLTGVSKTAPIYVNNNGYNFINSNFSGYNLKKV